MEILAGISNTLRFPAAGDDEVAFGSTPKVTIVRDSDGSVVVDEASATKVEAAGKVPAVYYSYVLAAEHAEEVDLLTATWSDGASSYTSSFEVVGGFVVSRNAIKERLGEGEPEDWELDERREIATREIEDACGIAFRARYAKEKFSGEGQRRLFLPRRELQRVIRVEIEGTGEVFSDEEIAALVLDPFGAITRESAVWPLGKANITIAYVYGQEHTPAKLPIRDYAAYMLTERPTDYDERATGLSTEYGTYQFVTPGVRGAQFPLPSVNAFVNQYTAPMVG